MIIAIPPPVQQHDERQPKVQGTDILVVGRRNPAHQALGRTVMIMLVVSGVVCNFS
jgi:hypothetical protein